MASNQGDLWQIEIDNEDLEAALEFLYRNETVRKDLNSALRTKKTAIQNLEERLRDSVPGFDANGARVKVGRFVVPVKMREGSGEVTIGEWRRPVAGKVERLADE